MESSAEDRDTPPGLAGAAYFCPGPAPAGVVLGHCNGEERRWRNMQAR
jgi:hypothetical protein